jgi:hypothetical protein
MQIAFTLPMLNFRNPQLLDEQIFSERLHPRFLLSARTGAPVMSAVRSLSGVNRTWRGHRQTDATDPMRTSCRVRCPSSISHVVRRKAPDDAGA